MSTLIQGVFYDRRHPLHAGLHAGGDVGLSDVCSSHACSLQVNRKIRLV